MEKHKKLLILRWLILYNFSSVITGCSVWFELWQGKGEAGAQMPLPRKEIFIPLWSFGLTMVRIGIRRSELPPSLLRKTMAFYLERTKAENTVTLMTVWQWHGQSTDIAKWLGSNKTKSRWAVTLVSVKMSMLVSHCQCCTHIACVCTLTTDEGRRYSETQHSQESKSHVRKVNDH